MLSTKSAGQKLGEAAWKSEAKEVLGRIMAPDSTTISPADAKELRALIVSTGTKSSLAERVGPWSVSCVSIGNMGEEGIFIRDDRGGKYMLTFLGTEARGLHQLDGNGMRPVKPMNNVVPLVLAR